MNESTSLIKNSPSKENHHEAISSKYTASGDDELSHKLENRVLATKHSKLPLLVLGSSIFFAAAVCVASFFPNADIGHTREIVGTREQDESTVSPIFSQAAGTKFEVDHGSSDVTFYEMGSKEGFCCCYSDVVGPSTCSASDQDSCLCESDGRNGVFFAPPKKEGTDYGACGGGDSFWWSSKKDCTPSATPSPGNYLRVEKVISDTAAAAAKSAFKKDVAGIQGCTYANCLCTLCCENYMCEYTNDEFGGTGPKVHVCVSPDGRKLKSNDTDTDTDKGGEVGIMCGCFSSQAMVDVMERGMVPIHEVKVGDYIKSRKDGTYSRVFGFHRNNSVKTFFHRIHMANASFLEVTPRHMVFLNGKQAPIPASQVKVGDFLQQLDSMGAERNLQVTKIDSILRQGFYAPITEDGTLVVNGIVASSFSVHPKRGDSVTFDNMGLIHWHGLSHMAVSPIRFICKSMWSEFCTSEQFHDEEGLHKYIIFLKQLRGLPDWQQAFVLPAVLSIGLLFNAAEYVYDIIADGNPKLADGIEASILYISPPQAASK